MLSFKPTLVSTRHLDAEKFLVVNNWQDDENFTYIPAGEADGPFKFVYLGSINNHSNVELMICAFHKANLPNAKLMLYGGGNRKGVCQELVKENNAKNIEFSLVDRKDVPAVQTGADVLILALPTGNGTLCLPSKLTSYMLSGRPIIASVDLDSTTASYIQQSQSGIVVPPDNEEALMDAFSKMANKGRDELVIMGEGSRKFALEHLTKQVNLSIVIASIEKELMKKDNKVCKK